MSQLKLKSIAAITLAVITTTALVLADAGDQPATDQPQQKDQPTAAQTQAQPTAETKKTESSEDVINQLLQSRKPRPLITPTEQPIQQVVSGRTAPPSASPNIDPNVIGVAPGQDPPKLMREGDFVINRRGRLVRSADGIRSIFIFEADSQAAPEQPMILIPCQLLETMENLIQKRGEQLLFRIAGQVTVYRGANHLLPTMVKPVIQSQNLR